MMNTKANSTRGGRRLVRWAGFLLTAGLAAAPATAGDTPARGESVAGDPQGLFEAPVALADQDGQPIVTKRACGHLAGKARNIEAP